MSEAERAARLLEEGKRLESLVNRRLYRANVQADNPDAVSAIVDEIAPGWRWADATTVRHVAAAIILTRYERGRR